MRRLTAFLVFALVWPFAAAAEPSAELQAKMTGRFRLAESEAVVQQRLSDAIDHAVDPMNFVARPIARSRLRRPVYYCKAYQLALGPETVRIECDDRPPVERRLDNSEGPAVGLDAEPLDVRVQVGGDAVELAFKSADGTRITNYRFGDRGELEVSVRVESPSLERPVTWKVRYLKTPAA